MVDEESILKNTNYLLNSKYEIPSYEEFDKIDLNEIYDIECKMKDKNMVSVLNRRSHMKSYNWKGFTELIRYCKIAYPKVYVNLYDY